MSLVSSAEQRGGHFRLQCLSRARPPSKDYERFARVTGSGDSSGESAKTENRREPTPRFAKRSRRFASKDAVERHTLHISYTYISVKTNRRSSFFLFHVHVRRTRIPLTCYVPWRSALETGKADLQRDTLFLLSK